MNARIEKLCRMLEMRTHARFRTRQRYALNLSRQTAREPIIVRKALALARQLSDMPIYIQDDELIVGGRTVFAFTHYLTAAEKADAIPLEKEGYDYVFNRVYNHCQDERGWGSVEGICPGHAQVLSQGLAGIKQMAQDRLIKRRATDSTGRDFYRAVIITCDATVAFARRYARQAFRLQTQTRDPRRKQELAAIARICRRVPEYSPRTFHEALQSVWFIHMITWLEGHYLVPLGRLDQVVRPYYQADRRQGRLTDAQALELLECLWIKLNADADMTHTAIPGDTGQTLTLGGRDAGGLDQTNAVSYLALQATAEIRKSEPQLIVRMHARTPDDFLHQAAALSIGGLGMPLFCNDDAILPMLEQDGYRPADAADYALGGCWEITVHGKANDRTNSGRVNFLRALEWALNNGRSFRPGLARGLPTGDCRRFKTLAQLKAALKQQIIYYIDTIVANCNRARFAPAPFLSATTEDCLAKGRDLADGGARYNNTGLLSSGLANTVDALIAIDQLVYREKRLTLPELLAIVLKDFKGHEALRQQILNRLPKFGNGIPAVDRLANELAGVFIRETRRRRNQRGGHFRPMLASASDFVSSVSKLGASADGRLSGRAFGSNFSPAPGNDQTGPTAVVDSAAAVDQKRASMGAVLDLRFHPSAVQGAKGLATLATLIRVYFERQGLQVQFNVVDDRVLRAAQQNPADYQNLLVRVYGFSTTFVALEKDLQDQIIARTAHGV